MFFMDSNENNSNVNRRNNSNLNLIDNNNSTNENNIQIYY